MRLTYANLRLTNLLNDQSITIDALVDSGASHLCLPEKVAVQLGFDLEEVPTTIITLADGRSREVPKVRPVEIRFANRDCTVDALVLGDEPLLGVIPMEAMDVVLDPKRQQLVVNPAHPNYPVFHAKGFSHRR